MLCVVFYICIVYPYYIGFLRKFPGGILYYIEVVISISLLFNILMNSVTAIRTKKKYIKTFYSIISYKMNTLGFYLDLIANIPLEHLVSIHTYAIYRDNHRKHLFYMSKGIKLCLVWRLSSFFENLEKKLLLNTIVVKVSKNSTSCTFILKNFRVLSAYYYIILYLLQVIKYCVYICLLCYWCGVILYMESCFVNRCSEGSWYTKVLSWEYQTPGLAVNRYLFYYTIFFQMKTSSPGLMHFLWDG